MALLMESLQLHVWEAADGCGNSGEQPQTWPLPYLTWLETTNMATALSDMVRSHKHGHCLI